MNMEKPKKILKNKMKMITCNHCHKQITSPELVGLTLVCPHCKKSVNGQYYTDFKKINYSFKIIKGRSPNTSRNSPSLSDK
jgi:phage FluMu protein Com